MPLLRPGHEGLPDSASAGRFEGAYGGIYDRAIQSPFVRRLAPLTYGPAPAITDLEGLVRRAAADDPPIILDVPTGGGTLIPMLRDAGFRGRILASDLGAAMLRRAQRYADEDTAFLRADASDLPLADDAVDAAISLNGLHCIPDQQGFVAELGRVVKPGGRLWLVTLVSGGNRRGDLISIGGQLTGILPVAPPRRETLEAWLAGAGFTGVEPLGGEALMGYAATRA